MTWTSRASVMRWVGCVAIALSVGGPTARGQAGGPNRVAIRFHPDSSFTAESLLRTAAAHVKQGQWAEAIDLYQRVIREFGETVAQLPKDDAATDPTGSSQLFVDARANCHRRLAGLPPEARALYRNRVDPAAEAWFRDGKARRDRALLLRIVEEAFCSSFGDDALLLLGDLAFQEGRFGDALARYRQVVPDNPDEPEGLVHPDPDVDLARVAARKLLCRAALGEHPPGAADLEVFAKTYPDATGSLAGRNGSLVEALAGALKQDGLVPSTQADARWATFAGTSERTKVAPAAIDVGSFQWKVRLEPIAPSRTAGQSPFFMGGRMGSNPSPRADRGLAYHPIILGDQVVLCDANRLVAYNLGDRPASAPAAAAGAAEVPVAWDQSLAGGLGLNSSRMALGTPRFTVTASGDRIFARLGPPGSRLGPSYLVAVRNNREVDGKLLWRRSSLDVTPAKQRGGGPGGRNAAFEGTPVADARNVYIALTESGTMTSTYVACLDAETGATRWVRFLGQATAAFDAMMGMPFTDDVGNRLLSLHDSTVYYQTNLGAVAALDAETGAIRWLATYPQRDARAGAGGLGRDLNPAVVHGGLVYVAPDDAPEVYAFDAATGRMAWKSDPLPQATHLLGVAQGRVILTGNKVWSLEARTGKVLVYWPQVGEFQGYGRGVLAGDAIYWPTRTEIHVLDQATGLKSDRGPIPLEQAFGTGGGNLAVGDGYLVVAQEEALVVFCQNSRLIDRYREAIAAAPDQAANYVRLARVAEATGQDELALANLKSAVERARPAELLDGQSLAEQAQAQRFKLLMRLGGQAAGKADWAAATTHYRAATESAGADRDRLAARLLLAEASDRKGDAKAAVALLQEALADDGLRGLTVAADERRTVRADLLIADRLAAILKVRGRELYAEHEAAARDLLERGRKQGDARLLAEVGRTYPVAQVADEALLSLGRVLEADQDPAGAARAYRRLLATAGDEATRARALLGLARAYEAQGYVIPARDLYARAQGRYADLRLDDAGGTVGSLAAERLLREPFARLAGAGAEPRLPTPLMRTWSVRWGTPARPIAAEGVPPSGEAGQVFLAEGSLLRPIDPASGRYAWSANLQGEASWVGYLADRVLAATDSRLVAIDVRTGDVRWTFDAGDPNPARRVPNPFARASADAPTGRLQGFRIVGSRVFCLRGDRELLAIDGDAGLIDWVFAPASGRLNPRLHVGPRRVVLQVLEPGAAVVLDTATGARRAEFPQGEESDPWVRDPLPVDDDHVALVVDDRTVALLDLARGWRRGRTASPRPCRGAGRRGCWATPAACSSCAMAASWCGSTPCPARSSGRACSAWRI